MLALCELGTGSGTTMFAFGSRRIALVAQVEDRTVRRSLGRLVTAGWLERLPATKLGDADTYRFGEKLDKMTAHTPPPYGGRCGSYDQIDPDRVSLHPVFRNGSGLGQGPGRTWLILKRLSEPSTAKEIAETGATKSRTVSRHLKLLLRATPYTQSATSGWLLHQGVHQSAQVSALPAPPGGAPPGAYLDRPVLRD
jgi:DNA-binding MarR family transcriptional regulator